MKYIFIFLNLVLFGKPGKEEFFFNEYLDNCVIQWKVANISICCRVKGPRKTDAIKNVFLFLWSQ